MTESELRPGSDFVRLFPPPDRREAVVIGEPDDDSSLSDGPYSFRLVDADGATILFFDKMGEVDGSSASLQQGRIRTLRLQHDMVSLADKLAELDAVREALQSIGFTPDPLDPELQYALAYDLTPHDFTFRNGELTDPLAAQAIARHFFGHRSSHTDGYGLSALSLRRGDITFDCQIFGNYGPEETDRSTPQGTWMTYTMCDFVDVSMHPK